MTVLQASHEIILILESGFWKSETSGRKTALLLLPSSILDLPKIDVVVAVVVKPVEDITFAGFVPERLPSIYTNVCIYIYI